MRCSLAEVSAAAHDDRTAVNDGKYGKAQIAARAAPSSSDELDHQRETKNCGHHGQAD